MALKLILGNKNYSSWSLRPWIAMRHAGLDFEEEVIPLYEPGSREKVLTYSPAGKVPVLIDDGIPIWESLAILEHLAEKYPKAALWPADAVARARGLLDGQGVVLLSPGAPSFGAYRDYTERGRHFATLAGFDPDAISTIPGLGIL